jgi:hypothetical protein
MPVHYLKYNVHVLGFFLVTDNSNIRDASQICFSAAEKQAKYSLNCNNYDVNIFSEFKGWLIKYYCDPFIFKKLDCAPTAMVRANTIILLERSTTKLYSINYCTKLA